MPTYCANISIFFRRRLFEILRFLVVHSAKKPRGWKRDTFLWVFVPYLDFERGEENTRDFEETTRTCSLDEEPSSTDERRGEISANRGEPRTAPSWGRGDESSRTQPRQRSLRLSFFFTEVRRETSVDNIYRSFWQSGRMVMRLMEEGDCDIESIIYWKCQVRFRGYLGFRKIKLRCVWKRFTRKLYSNDSFFSFLDPILYSFDIWKWFS